MKCIVVFFSISCFFFSCNSNVNNAPNEDLNKALESRVSEFKKKLNMPNVFTLTSHENVLNIDMEIDTLYFTDIVTNDIIIHRFLFSLFDYVSKFDTVKVSYYYKWDKSNIRDLEFDKSVLIEKEWITRKTEDGKKLSCVIEDVLLNLKYSTLNSYNIVLSDFKKLDDQRLLSKYNSFWDYIVLFCESDESNKDDLKLFYELTQYEIYNVDGSFILNLIEKGCSCNEKTKERTLYPLFCY